MPATYDVLGVSVSAVDLGAAVDHMAAMIRQKTKGYVCVAPVSTIVDCQRNPAYRAIVNAASMVTPDGMPVVWVARGRGLKQVQRTYGPDLMRHTCAAGLKEGWRHYFLGGTQENNTRLQEVLNKEFPGIRIAGMWAPPFRSNVEIEHPDVLSIINQAKADILWVGLGSPKQDFWMSAHRGLLDVPVMVGVGAAFDFLAGAKAQAPRWMQRSGLEWLFRFACEPRRLWKRYLVGNTLFTCYLLRDMIKPRTNA